MRSPRWSPPTGGRWRPRRPPPRREHGPVTTLLLLQLLAILVAARGCGLLLRRFGQPAVVGEMAAGVLLGPVVFGQLWPATHAALFPATSLAPLSALATLGLVLFMFVVGAELRAPQGLRSQVRAAGLVGACAFFVPMAMGLVLAVWLYPALAPDGLAFWPFALFFAAAMSITAFPVLARILKDRGMTRTGVGQLSLNAAALADVFTWMLLALILALAGGGDGYAGFTRVAGGLLLIVALVFLVLRPLYAWLLRRHPLDEDGATVSFGLLLAGMLACAAATEWVGLHAVFGAFLFGACLPRDDRLLAVLIERIEHIAVVALMPIFFALAGLGMSADAFTGGSVGVLAAIVAVAVAGKVAGGALGARLAGHPWRPSLAVGSLMNARGLMELVVIKVGLDAGLIGPVLFTMLFAMAILTTVMTGPLLALLARGPRPAVQLEGGAAGGSASGGGLDT
ncbi:cation:proton antiporter [Luteimonas sp. MC1572]|nr:cation:proton antiporter [Luteimonas sp. MC1572]QQO03045.1 cation:proton antiporter [Luteimonas sp. MC1572]